MHGMQATMQEATKAGDVPGQPSSRPEPVDFSEALLSSEKLPMDLPEDAPAGVSQVQHVPPLPNLLLRGHLVIGARRVSALYIFALSCNAAQCCRAILYLVLW